MIRKYLIYGCFYYCIYKQTIFGVSICLQAIDGEASLRAFENERTMIPRYLYRFNVRRYICTIIVKKMYYLVNYKHKYD